MPEHAPISLLILTHNNYDMLREWLDMAAKCATVKEILILNNGSSDQTKFMHSGNINVGGYKTGVKVSVLHLHENIGVIRGRNMLATAASQPYIMFLDDDQFLSEDSIEKLYSSMVDGGFDAVGALACECDENGVGKEIDGLNGGKREYLGAGGLLIKRDVFQAVGGFDETFGMAYCEDPDLTWRLVEAGHRIGRCSDHGITHRPHSTLHRQTDFDNETQHAESHKLLMEKWHKYFDSDHGKRRVAILMLTHDDYEIFEDYFRRNITSIDWEMSELHLLLNGCDTNRYRMLIDNYKWLPIKVYHTVENISCSPGRAHLTGMVLHNSYCDYLMFLDDDMYVSSGFENEIIRAMDNDHTLGAVQGVFRQGRGEFHGSTSCNSVRKMNPTTELIANRKKPEEFGIVHSDTVAGGITAWRRECLTESYMIMKLYPAGFGDYALSMMARLKGWSLACTNAFRGDHCQVSRTWRKPETTLVSTMHFKSQWGVIYNGFFNTIKADYEKYVREEFGITLEQLLKLGFRNAKENFIHS